VFIFLQNVAPHSKLGHLHLKPLWQVYRSLNAGRITRGMCSSSFA